MIRKFAFLMILLTSLGCDVNPDPESNDTVETAAVVEAGGPYNTQLGESLGMFHGGLPTDSLGDWVDWWKLKMPSNNVPIDTLEVFATHTGGYVEVFLSDSPFTPGVLVLESVVPATPIPACPTPGICRAFIDFRGGGASHVWVRFSGMNTIYFFDIY